MRRRGWVGLLVWLALAGATPAAGAASACPGPYCRHYFFLRGTARASHQPIDPDRIARIPYWVNPDYQPWLTSEEFVGAVRAAAATWERADPSVRLQYMGITATQPDATHDDGKFVVGWIPVDPAATALGVTYPHGGGNQRPDIAIVSHWPWAWYPCDTGRSGSCTLTRPKFVLPAVPGTTVAGLIDKIDVQIVLTHEFGHALGLDHADDGLTMATGCWDESSVDENGQPYVCRAVSTLGLGDILGLRALYPYTCPKLRRGQSMPVRYRQVCPGIKVFVP